MHVNINRCAERHVVVHTQRQVWVPSVHQSCRILCLSFDFYLWSLDLKMIAWITFSVENPHTKFTLSKTFHSWVTSMGNVQCGLLRSAPPCQISPWKAVFQLRFVDSSAIRATTRYEIFVRSHTSPIRAPYENRVETCHTVDWQVIIVYRIKKLQLLGDFVPRPTTRLLSRTSWTTLGASDPQIP